MRPVTAAFLDQIRQPHRVAVEAWFFAADGSDPVEVPITGGTVTLEAVTAIRGRADIQVEHTEWIPKTAFHDLSPFGVGVIELRRGVFLPNGMKETVPLVQVGIEDAEVVDDGTGAVASLSALDRAEAMSKAKFEDTYQLPAGKAFTEAIVELARDADPAVRIANGFLDMSSLAIGKPVTAQAGDDRWEFMQGLATALGMLLYFGGSGILTLRPYAEHGPVLDLIEGSGGILLSAGRAWSRTASFNRVVVTSEGAASNTIYRGVATDENPLSPTYYHGPFGKCPEFRSFTEIVSDQQAADVAASILAQHLGAPSTVNFGMVPNPALEPEDTVRIERKSVGVKENHIIDSLTIGLSASEQMTGTTRERLAF